ncbi:MAG TPA: hypothetical protein VFE51_09165, partial [Verrucomicrobiae bacterium]|nr:hypothetical protein [Verrucomicrobiae bacterium]
YLFDERGEFYVKDKGELKTYFLKGRNPIWSKQPMRQLVPTLMPSGNPKVQETQPGLRFEVQPTDTLNSSVK